MKKLLLLFLVAVSVVTVQAQTTTVYIVRHGEKDVSNATERDPALSADGEARAMALAEKLAASNVTAIFSTNYKRTKNTAIPLATANKIDIQTYNPSDAKALAAKVLAEYSGKTVLLVGHSNTILELAEAFGATRPMKALTDDDYDNLIRVTVSPEGISATSEKFGKPHHAGN